MKHLPNIFIFLALITVTINAQSTNTEQKSEKEYPFVFGEKAISLSWDITNTYDITVDYFGLKTTSSKPKTSVHLEYEHGINSKASISGVFYYSTKSLALPFHYGDLLNFNFGVDTSGLKGQLNSIECMMNPMECNARIEESVKVYSIGGKFKYHMSLIKALNTYISINFYHNLIDRKTTIDPLIEDLVDVGTLDITVPKFSYFFGFGIRYFLLPNLGLFSEIGFDNVIRLNLGLSFKFS